MEPVRPKEGILEPVAGREADAPDAEVERLGSKSASEGAPDCDGLFGVQEMRREAEMDEWDGL